jgi:hypothetical protein
MKSNIYHILSAHPALSESSLTECRYYDYALVGLPFLDYDNRFNFFRLMAEQIRAGRIAQSYGEIFVHRERSLKLTADGLCLVRSLARQVHEDTICQWTTWLHYDSLVIYAFHARTVINYQDEENIGAFAMVRIIKGLEIRRNLVAQLITELATNSNRDLGCDRIVEYLLLQPVTAIYLKCHIGAPIRYADLIERLQLRLWCPDNDNTEAHKLHIKALKVLEKEFNRDVRDGNTPSHTLIASIVSEAFIALSEKPGDAERRRYLTNCLSSAHFKVLQHTTELKFSCYLVNLYMVITNCTGNTFIDARISRLFMELNAQLIIWLNTCPVDPAGSSNISNAQPYSNENVASCLLFWMLKYCEICQMQHDEYRAMERFIEKNDLRVPVPDMSVYVDIVRDMINQDFIGSKVSYITHCFISACTNASNEPILIYQDDRNWIDSMQIPRNERLLAKQMERIAYKYKEAWKLLVHLTIYREDLVGRAKAEMFD